MPSRREGRDRRARALLFSAALALGTTPAAAGGGQPPGGPCAAGRICTSSGEDVETLSAIVQEQLAPYLAAKAIRGATVGISWRGRRTYFGYGYSDRDGTRPYDPATIVEIGSITKVFTTALFAEAVAEGKVQLDGALGAYADALGVASLTPCGGAKTLRQLADFSSGMPRLPDVRRPPPNIDAYTVADFSRWLAGWTPADAGAPGGCAADAPYEYSNASVGVLGLVVAGVYRQPWFEMVRSRIAGPLGMHSTYFDVPPGQAGRTAQGYAADGSPARPWPVYAWFASGVLRSDAADMLSFGEAALGADAVNGIPARAPAVGALEAALSSAMASNYTRPAGGHTLGQGLAWEELIPGASQFPIFVKDGGTSGFSTVLAVNRRKDLAVFVALPKGGADAQMIGVRLVRQIGSGG